MESDLQITVKGVAKDLATNIGEAILELIQALDDRLDFRRMHRIVIASDFAGELAEQSKKTASGNAIKYTNEEYAVTIAKVLLQKNDGRFEIVPVVNAQIASVLVQEDEKGYNSDQFKTVLHLLHHELCHVHDDNKMVDAFPDVLLSKAYVGKDRYVRRLAEVCWSEYLANYLSSSTANESSIEAMAGSLADAITRTKGLIDDEILKFRYHGDVGHLMEIFERHGEFLIKTAAYVLGYVDGLEKPLKDLDARAALNFKGSYFEKTWEAMHDALTKMRTLYPDNWKDLGIYDELAEIVERYYDDMGLILSATEDGQTYIGVPFRPETTPKH